MNECPRALLFDLDGTLLDTAPDLARALNRVVTEDGGEALPYAAIRPCASHGSAGLLRLAYGYPPDSAEFESRRQRLLDAYRAALAVETRLFPGMEQVLAHCDRAALPWGIVTNKPGYLTLPLLAALALDRRAACVIAGDSTPHSKPHPAPLLAAAAALGLAPAMCLYVGDAECDVRAAHAAGMPVVVATYGYLAADDDPASWGACGAIDDPAALLAWLTPA
ncbi:MAG: HAD-IA family hydrolase [Gammaproteobacteria bacterium]